MHLRRDRQQVGAKTHVYLSIAHAITEDSPLGKRSKPIIMANLGNEVLVSEKHARQLMRSFEKYIHQRWGGTPTAEEVKETARELKPRERELRMLTSREFGMRLLLEVAWRGLHIGKALSAFAAEHRIEFDFERIVFAMVLNRLSDPKSKHACNIWAKERAYLPDVDDADVQHYYRSLDLLHTHWSDLEKALEKVIWKDLSPEERSLRLIDTTSLYFEARMNDEELKKLADAWEKSDADPTVKSPRRRRPETVNERKNSPAHVLHGHAS